MWRGLVVVLAKASWPAADRLPRHLEDLLGPDWVAVAGEPVIGVEGIAATMGRLTLSLRTALRIGREGWISAPTSSHSRSWSRSMTRCWTRPSPASSGRSLPTAGWGRTCWRPSRSISTVARTCGRPAGGFTSRHGPWPTASTGSPACSATRWTAPRTDGCPSRRSPTACAGGRLRADLDGAVAPPDLADTRQEFARQIGRTGACRTSASPTR